MVSGPSLDELRTHAASPGWAYRATSHAAFLVSHHDHDERAQGEHRGGGGDTHHAHDGHAVAARHRVVVKAVEQQRIDGRPDLAVRRFDNRIPQVAWAVFDAEQISRQAPVRREHDDAGRVRELLRIRVPHISEAGRLREAIDGRLVARQEVPRRRGARLFVARDVTGFLRRGGRRRVARIEADGDDLEILAGLEREHVERAREPVDDERAEHRAVVVREHQHDRPRPEVVAERHGTAGFVPEGGVERDLQVQVLVEADLAQRRRQRRRWQAGSCL